MDDIQFLRAVPDLTSVLGEDEEARQDVLLRLWRRRESISDMERCARRAAKNRRIDRNKRRTLERMHTVPLTLQCDRESDAASPLDATIAAEDGERLREAIGTLPPGQRRAVESRLAQTGQQAQMIESTTLRRPHHSNFCKAQANLRRLLGCGPQVPARGMA